VNDPKRLQYLQDYLVQVLKAKNEGCNVNGYFVWTLTDNFEWAEGYHPRFGLVHVDHNTQKRTIKASGKWFASFLKTNAPKEELTLEAKSRM
jgi:beta-glucosidase